jgi:hypothetical protein
VTVVFLSAVVPTLFAKDFFRPRIELGEAGPAAGKTAQGLIRGDAETVADQREVREVAGALDE